MRRDRTRILAALTAAMLAAAMTSVALPDQARLRGESAAPEAVRQVSAAGAPLRIGGRLDPARLHQVTRPGLYGMSQPPAGSRYGIAQGQLIRYDPQSAQVLSIIRQVDQILD